MAKKKLILIIIAAILALAVLITGSIILVKNLFKGESKSSTGDFTISVADTEAKVGDTISVAVSCKGNPGVMAVMGAVKYDSSVLTYKGYKEGSFFSDYMFNEKDGSVSFNIVENEDVDENGDMFYLEFEVSGDSSEKTNLELSIIEGGICNFDEELFTPALKNGTVKINK